MPRQDSIATLSKRRNSGSGFAGFDHAVKVDKAPRQQLRERLANGRLPCAHKANQKEGRVQVVSDCVSQCGLSRCKGITHSTLDLRAAGC